MATFDGVDLGLIEEFTSAPAEKAWQRNSYPGVDGWERLDMGARGKRHRCRAIVAGTNAADLGSILQTLGGYVLAGTSATLVDANGTSWAGCVMVRFQPTGPRYPLFSSPSGVAQRYEAEWEDDI